MRQSAWPRIGEFFFVSVFAGCLLIGQRMLNVDSDLGRHLVLGRHMIRSGHIPDRDILSFTLYGESRPPYAWASQVVFGAADLLLGLDGVVLVSASVLAGSYLVAFLDARARSGKVLGALLLAVVAIAASSMNWLTRPHLFSFLFLAIWLRLLENLRLGQRGPTWELPLLMLVWANFHGGFVVGFLGWAAYCLGYLWELGHGTASRDRGARIMLSGASSLVASFATPAPGRNWIAVLGNNSPYVLSRTAETMPLDLGAPSSWPFAAMVFLALLLAIPRRKKLVAAHVFLLLTLAAAAWAIGRNTGLFTIAAVPILASWLASSVAGCATLLRLDLRLSQIEPSGGASAWAWSAVALATLGLGAQAATSQRSVFSYEQSIFPVGAANWMLENPVAGNMFNDLNWGGYLLYRMWPEHLVFVDSQSDFYGERFIRDYADTLAGRGDWEAQLNRYQVAWVLIPPGAGLADQLLKDGDWRMAYRDATAVVFVREPTWFPNTLSGKIDFQ